MPDVRTPPSYAVMRAVNRIITAERPEFDELYGPDGSDPKDYHDIVHTDEVLGAAENIGSFAVARGLLSRRDYHLLRAAAFFHDRIHKGRRNGMDEHESANIAVEKMKLDNRNSRAFCADDYTKVTGYILATTVTFGPEGMTQAVNPEDYGTLALADADIAVKGKPFEIARPRVLALFREHTHRKPACTGEFMNFLMGEDAFIGKPFHTAEAEELYPHRLDNITAFRELRDHYAVQ